MSGHKTLKLSHEITFSNSFFLFFLFSQSRNRRNYNFNIFSNENNNTSKSKNIKYSNNLQTQLVSDISLYLLGFFGSLPCLRIGIMIEVFQSPGMVFSLHILFQRSKRYCFVVSGSCFNMTSSDSHISSTTSKLNIRIPMKIFPKILAFRALKIFLSPWTQ